ncbi:MAG: hypothetical protein HGJ94_01665 [Desulfosarcina sp.]|nr:hypothetical protein [Desulfosarcina sp.]
MKHLLFVSCGRCGTVRLAQILRKKLPEEKYAVVHQMKYSRLANVIGNILYYVRGFDWLKEKLYLTIISSYRKGKHFVNTDPLTAMIIPESILNRPDTYIVHVQRDHDEFARSMVAFSHKRLKSRIAHNLIPFWQPGIIPLENQLRSNVHLKYRQVSVVKNQFFVDRYGELDNYFRVDMKDLFSSDRLAVLIKNTIGESIVISKEELSRKANES